MSTSRRVPMEERNELMCERTSSLDKDVVGEPIERWREFAMIVWWVGGGIIFGANIHGLLSHNPQRQIIRAQVPARILGFSFIRS